MKKRILLLATLLLLITGISMAQGDWPYAGAPSPFGNTVLTQSESNCPIVFMRITDYGNPGFIFKVKNTYTKAIYAIKVSPIQPYDAFMKPYHVTGVGTVGAGDGLEPLKPGKSTTYALASPWAYLDSSASAGGLDVGVSNIAFADGSQWVADATHYCKASIRYPAK